MTNTALVPTTASLHAVYCLNKALIDLDETLPSFLSPDEKCDLVGNAIALLFDEDEDTQNQGLSGLPIGTQNMNGRRILHEDSSLDLWPALREVPIIFINETHGASSSAEGAGNLEETG